MFRILVALLGLAVVFAVFAGIYYAPSNVELRESAGAFNLAPGEVRQESLQPSLAGSDIVVEVEVIKGTIDVYVMDKEWAADLPDDGRLHLTRPFAFYSRTSAEAVNDTHTFAIHSDGKTWKSIIFDNSDNYYDGDTVPLVDLTNGTDGTARIKVTARFVDEEERSLVLGYLAAVPSVLLVLVTLSRSYARLRDQRHAERAAAENEPAEPIDA